MSHKLPAQAAAMADLRPLSWPAAHQLQDEGRTTAWLLLLPLVVTCSCDAGGRYSGTQ